jgi:hypothetical protein
MSVVTLCDIETKIERTIPLNKIDYYKYEPGYRIKIYVGENLFVAENKEGNIEELDKFLKENL